VTEVADGGTRHPKVFSPKDMETRVVKNFLDILILIEIKKQSNISGYDVRSFVNRKFGDIISPGTIYAALHSLQDKGLIVGESDGRKTVYRLTQKGQDTITCLMPRFSEQMTKFVRSYLRI
jgi:DNA-binding PadR family transcriptional regulator